MVTLETADPRIQAAVLVGAALGGFVARPAAPPLDELVAAAARLAVYREAMRAIHGVDTGPCVLASADSVAVALGLERAPRGMDGLPLLPGPTS